MNAICHTYDSLLATLQEISYGSDHTKAIEAKSLHCQVATFAFIVTLVMFDRIPSCTKSLSDHLQSTQVDLAKAADLVSATKSTLEEYHTDNFWGEIYRYSVSIAELHEIELQWNLRREDKLGPGVLSFIERMSSLRGYDQNAIFYTQNHIAGYCDYQKSITIMRIAYR